MYIYTYVCACIHVGANLPPNRTCKVRGQASNLITVFRLRYLVVASRSIGVLLYLLLMRGDLGRGLLDNWDC